MTKSIISYAIASTIASGHSARQDKYGLCTSTNWKLKPFLLLSPRLKLFYELLLRGWGELETSENRFAENSFCRGCKRDRRFIIWSWNLIGISVNYVDFPKRWRQKYYRGQKLRWILLENEKSLFIYPNQFHPLQSIPLSI